MKRLFRMVVFFCCAGVAVVHAQDTATMRRYDISPIVVRAKRPLADIGVQKTVLDTFQLRENVINSFADVLAQSSSIYVKSYGRATLATASFRGTAPSHTQVSWNGMQINSPMLGMVDFSLIPSFFIDDAQLYHGASSVGVTGGGLGGAVTLGTKPLLEQGAGLRLIQGVSSFNTWDEYLRFTYGSKKWHSSTRVYYASSDNDFKYTNINKWDYTLDEENHIIGRKRPVERNKNGDFKDLHIMQELYYTGDRGSRWGLSAWYMDSKRGVPMLNVDWREENDSKSRQDEKTFRGVLSWDRSLGSAALSAKAGYTYTDLFYHWLRGLGNGEYAEAIRSQSYVHTAFGSFGAEYYLGDKWIFSGDVSLHQHLVNSLNKPNAPEFKDNEVLGYDKGRFQASAFVSARYKPTERLGLAVNLRGEMYGDEFTPLIPAGFFEYLVSKKGAVYLKASVARNYRYPTLNDLYFQPGGNPDLKSEHGLTYDAGFEFTLKNGGELTFKGEGTYFDSYINDWILWLPTQFGWWTPMNVKKVHSYGVELKGNLSAKLGDRTFLSLIGNYSLTNAINRGDPQSWGDEAVGKQLVYIPKHSASVTGRLAFRSWQFVYKWNYYSERFTTSSNEITKTGRVAPYFMSDISLEKSFTLEWAQINLKATVNNLFNEEYESVLSRPMPGRNFGFFIEFTPAFNKKK